MSNDMDVVIDFEFFRRRQKEIVVKELPVAAKHVSESFRSKSPYSMSSHGTYENRFNWEDGNIAYHDLYTMTSEALADFAHLHGYGITKCTFPSELLSRPILNQQDFNCLRSTSLITNAGAACVVTNFPT